MNRSFLILPFLLALASVTMAATAPPGPRDDASSLPLPEFMVHVLQRNAVQLWHWSAWDIDETGEHSGKPITTEEWEDAESDSLTIQQLSYVLQQGSLRVDDPRWDQHLAGLRAAAVASAQAAEKRDFAALEKAGNDVNDQCVACHMTFAPQLEAMPE